MKKPHCRRAAVAGGVLLLTLFIVAVLCLVLGTYLHLVQTENLSVARSQAWNGALALAEAGIEEGMAQLNSAFGTNNMRFANANGWSGPTAGIYGPKTNALTNGYYSVTIDTTGPLPVIASRGYAKVPAISATVSRAVQVTAATAPDFSGAMVALQNATFNGNNIYIDSFDSSDPAHSTNGLYYFPWRKAGGDVASTYGFLDVKNADIKGKIFTGPTGAYGIGNNGSVGDLNWNGPGVEPGWYTNDWNLDFPDVSVPYTNGLPLAAGSGTNQYVLGGTQYQFNGDLTVSNGNAMLVTGNAALYVTGSVTFKANAAVVIQSGASLTLYVGGASSTFSQVNNFGNATNFQYFGLSGNTSLSWSGNATYTGTVYAPEATFTLSGSGNQVTNDYQGACVVQAVTMNGHFNFHYDEALRKRGPVKGFTVFSWQEL